MCTILTYHRHSMLIFERATGFETILAVTDYWRLPGDQRISRAAARATAGSCVILSLHFTRFLSVLATSTSKHGRAGETS